MKAMRPFTKFVIGMGVVATLSLLYFHNKPVSPPNPTKESPVSSPPAETRSNQPPQNSLRISRQPLAGDSDEDLLRLARELISQSPEQAVAWAMKETDSAFRERLLFAVVRAWGEKDPNAAVEWASSQNEEWRFKRMEAALTGAVAQPEVALAIGKHLLVENPASGSAYCTALVGALNRANQFQAAFQLAADAPPDERRQWLDMTFRRWAAEQPQDAMRALASIADTDNRQQAFHSAVDGWAASDPKALVAYANTIAAGADRGYALGRAMVCWSEQNPAALAEWLNTTPSNPAYDAGASLLVSKTDGAERAPEAAMLWVQQISDPNLRFDAFIHVVNEWAQTDLAGAGQYISNAAWLNHEELVKAVAMLQNRMTNNTNNPEGAP